VWNSLSIAVQAHQDNGPPWSGQWPQPRDSCRAQEPPPARLLIRRVHRAFRNQPLLCAIGIVLAAENGMSIGPGQPISPAVGWAEEWQRLGWTAINQAMGHYLRGCANVAMARTPQQALVALHQTQTSLLRHSADTVAQITRLWRKQIRER
jgi:hypothetical protein